MYAHVLEMKKRVVIFFFFLQILLYSSFHPARQSNNPAKTRS